ncbi:hypothetical protein IFR05_013277 [Cadophora sp. M221]|nr:hypothetical protein IFR05_013277 [Cadophora sp. M221]
MASEREQRPTQQERIETKNRNEIESSARPAITVAWASTSTANTEGRRERGKSSERHLIPASAQQAPPSNRQNTAAPSHDYRPSERQEDSRYQQQAHTQDACPSIRQITTSESLRKKEASYYAEPVVQESKRGEGSFYGQTEARESRHPAVPSEAPVGRSRRHSPLRRTPTNPTRSLSRSPPLDEKTPHIFLKPISVLPPSGPEPTDTATLSNRQADIICDDLVRKVKNTQPGKMYDRAMEADRRGAMDDVLYDQVLDFFHRFLPMVFAAADKYVFPFPKLKFSSWLFDSYHNCHLSFLLTLYVRSDPIIINRRQILDHEKVWNIFGPRGEGLSRKDRGKNRPHPWYTRPKDKKLSFKEVVGEALDNLPRVQIVPGPAKRKEQERR